MENIDKPWWVKELESIFSASRGSQITDDMKRSANIALKIVRGEKWDDEAQAWIPGPPSWEVAAPQVVADERKLPPLPQYFPDIVNIRADEELRAQDYATQYARAALQAAQVQPLAVPDSSHWLDTPQTALGGKTAREGYAANPMYADIYAAPAAQGDARDAERWEKLCRLGAAKKISKTVWEAIEGYGSNEEQGCYSTNLEWAIDNEIEVPK